MLLRGRAGFEGVRFGTLRLYNVVWDFNVGNLNMETFVWELPFEILGMGGAACERLLWSSRVAKPSFGDFRFAKLLLGNFIRVGTSLRNLGNHLLLRTL